MVCPACGSDNVVCTLAGDGVASICECYNCGWTQTYTGTLLGTLISAGFLLYWILALFERYRRGKG